MPVTHGVTGSSPVRTALSKEKILWFLVNQRIFYLEGDKLNPSIQIMWTGDRVISDITQDGIQWINEQMCIRDSTRTVPVGGKFEGRQKDVYNIVLACHDKALEITRPGMRRDADVCLRRDAEPYLTIRPGAWCRHAGR